MKTFWQPSFVKLAIIAGPVFQKKSFLQEYAQFVEDVSTNGGGFDEKVDWNWSQNLPPLRK